VDPLRGRDANAPQDEDRWHPDGIADWVLSEGHHGQRKVELKFTRAERTSARPVKIKGESKPKSIILTKLQQERFDAFKNGKKTVSDAVRLIRGEREVDVVPSPDRELRSVDSSQVGCQREEREENTPVHRVVSEKPLDQPSQQHWRGWFAHYRRRRAASLRQETPP
jgi:hypothetical protein